MPGMGVYVASKHAVAGLTKNAAVEYAKQGIRVNAVSPAAIETGMYNRFFGSPEEKRPERDFISGLHPIGRTGTTDEIAHTVLFLCSDLSGFTTGANFALDGGFTAV